MKEVRVSEETMKFLTDFMTRINTQDNWATASPYYYVIRSSHWRVAHGDFTSGETRICRVDFEGDPTTFYSKEEFVKWFKEYNSDLEGTDEEINKLADEKYEELSEYTEEKYYEEEGCFLTEEAANKHLELNHYHYSEDSHVYLKHAFRNPELMDLLNAIGEVTGVGHKRH